MKVEIDLSEDVLKKFQALSVLRPMEGGIDSMISDGLEQWVNEQIIVAVTGAPVQKLAALASFPPEKAPFKHTRRKSAPPAPIPVHVGIKPNDFDAYDASGISEGLADEDEYEDQARTNDPEAFISSQGGLTEEAMARDMRVSDPAHEAKVDASTIKEKKLTGSDSYRTPEQLFAEHSGLPTPPAVADERAKKRRKTQSGKGRATQFTGTEENTI